MNTALAIEPVVKTLSLDASAARAFEHFTRNIHLWWPLATHSISLAAAKTVVFEAKEGGRIYEIDGEDRQREWGRVLACEAPRRLVFSWVLEAPEKATEVEVSFEMAGADKCTLTLIHRGWDNRPDGAEWRGKYDQGWDGVLTGYARSLSWN
jgi:uncharacterized protein YndB with AHSA1/START domain